MGEYKLDMHIHSVSSGHAYSTVTENARYAAQMGLEAIGITDHAPMMPGSCGHLHFLNMKILPDHIEGIRVYKGIELNILDSSGRTDKSISKGILSRLDYAIASLHIPCMAPLSAEENTNALCNAMENEFIKIIGHPTDPRYPINIEQVVASAKSTGTLLELNNASFNPSNGRKGGEEMTLEMLKECKRQNVSIILGSDAHYHTYIGDFSYCKPLLDAADFPEELIVNRSIHIWQKFIFG